jgi:hypothetical protein
MTTTLEDSSIPLRLKLSAAWGALMFLFIYADYFGLFRDGAIEDIMRGEIWVFDINQTFLMTMSIWMSIPALMVLFSAVLTPNWNRRANIGVSAAFLLITLGALAGETYAYYYYFSVLEVVLLVTIFRLAWTWPREASGIERMTRVEVDADNSDGRRERAS